MEIPEGVQDDILSLADTKEVYNIAFLRLPLVRNMVLRITRGRIEAENDRLMRSVGGYTIHNITTIRCFCNLLKSLRLNLGSQFFGDREWQLLYVHAGNYNGYFNLVYPGVGAAFGDPTTLGLPDRCDFLLVAVDQLSWNPFVRLPIGSLHLRAMQNLSGG